MKDKQTPIQAAREAFSAYANMDTPELPKDPMAALQVELCRWQAREFGGGSSDSSVLGSNEETGEGAEAMIMLLGAQTGAGRMAKAILKHRQGIRGFEDPEVFKAALGDAFADMMIFGIQACTQSRLDFWTLLLRTAEEVMGRKWSENKQDGQSSPEERDDNDPPKNLAKDVTEIMEARASGEITIKDDGDDIPKDLGYSRVAILSKKAWDGKNRPRGWRGEVYGLAVHTTGRGMPEKAAKAGKSPLERAENYYSRSHGCNYLCGYAGIAGGDLIQMSHENKQANGIGTLDQRKSILSGDWEGDLPSQLVLRLKMRWPGYANPLDLLPGTKTCNPAYLHLECLPLIPAFENEFIKPAFEGSMFTMAQYESIAELACDIAERNNWPDEWWRTPRLLGHEDLSPLTRHNKKGGAWDPGYLRKPMQFDWSVVIEIIIDKLGRKLMNSDFIKLPKPPNARLKGYYEGY